MNLNPLHISQTLSLPNLGADILREPGSNARALGPFVLPTRRGELGQGETPVVGFPRVSGRVLMLDSVFSPVLGDDR